jgi:hypothetical protein
LAGIALAVVAAIAFWPVASGRRSFFHIDLRYEHLPVWHVTQQALLAGDSPFWITGEYCGQPLLFIQEAPLLYPLTVPLLLTGAPVHRLADLFTLFHFWLAGLLAFLFLRELRIDVTASLFGGVAWMLSARLLQSALWPNAVAVSALLSLLLLGLARISLGKHRSGVLCAAAAGGLALLAGRPHVLVAAAPIILAAAVAAILQAADRRRALRDLAVAALLALALGAPSVLPSGALYPETSRWGSLERATRDPRPISLDLDQVFLPRDGGIRWPEAAAYPGVLVAVFFLVGVVFVRRRPGGVDRTFFQALAAGGALGLVIALLGDNGPYAAIRQMPVIQGFAVPARYLISWSLALALCSACGLSWVLPRSRALIATACLTVLAGDLVLHARRAAPTASAELQTIEPAVVSELRRRLGSDESGFPRRFSSRAEVFPFWLLDERARAEYFRLSEPLHQAIGMRYGLESTGGAGPALSRIRRLLGASTPRTSELTGVGCLVTSVPKDPWSRVDVPPALAVREFSSLPRAIVVPASIVVPRDRTLAITLAPAFDPRSAVILEEGPRSSGSWNAKGGSVQLTSLRPSQIELLASLPGDGVLVVFNAFERGWRATVDGAPTPVLVADAAFQAVRLRKGTHRVRLQYKPRGLREGVGFGVLGILGSVLVALRLSPSRVDADVQGGFGG